MVQPPIQGYMAVTQWSNLLKKAIWQKHNGPTPYTRIYGSNTMIQPPIQGYMAVTQWSNLLNKDIWQSHNVPTPFY